MDDDSQSWRRKLGVVTFALVCVFIAGWVRSHNVVDVFSMRCLRTSIVAFNRTSHLGIYLNHNISSMVRPSPFYSTAKIDEVDFESLVDQANISSDFEFIGFRAFQAIQEVKVDSQIDVRYVDMPITVCIVPYWSIVMPLTLLSIWLFLSKSRNKPLPVEFVPAPTA